MRYWSISTALWAAGNMLAVPIMQLATGQKQYVSEPLQFVGAVNTGIFVAVVVGHCTQLLRQLEPWWRWLQVFYFLPLSVFYLACQSVLIVISWFKLSCSRTHEWVPTARGSAPIERNVDPSKAAESS